MIKTAIAKGRDKLKREKIDMEKMRVYHCVCVYKPALHTNECYVFFHSTVFVLHVIHCLQYQIVFVWSYMST